MPKQRRPGGRTREVTERIHRATMALLVEVPLSEITFQSVAERAGVSRPTMYRKWSSPAHLVNDAVWATARDQIQISDTGSLVGDLRDALQRLGEFVSSPVGRAAVIAGVQLEPPQTSGWADRWLEIRPIFERALERKELGSEVDIEALLAMVAGALYFRLLAMGVPIDDAWLDRTVHMVRDGFVTPVE
jgi:AcrR family transcriptional regulator